VGALVLSGVAGCDAVLGIEAYGPGPPASTDAGRDVTARDAPASTDVAPRDGGADVDAMAPAGPEGGCETSTECPVGSACGPEGTCTSQCDLSQSCNGGCCRFADNTCQTGESVTECGSGGDRCVSCLANTAGSSCLSGGVCGCLKVSDCPAGDTCDTKTRTCEPLPAVYCGGTSTCPVPTGECCVSGGGGTPPTYECEEPPSPTHCEGGGGTPIQCDEQADCPGGQCCGTINTDDNGYVSVECMTTCPVGGVVFCDPKTVNACAAEAGETCTESTLLPGYYVCTS